jgi:hypothetical protein
MTAGAAFFAVCVLILLTSMQMRWAKILRKRLTTQPTWAAARAAVDFADPIFPWSVALTANQVDERPLANWQYRRLPFRAHVRVCQRATTNGVKTTIYSGSETIQQRAPEQGGGTAGVTPVHFTTPVKEWVGSPGDEIIISNDETLAGTPTVDGIVYVDPV